MDESLQIHYVKYTILKLGQFGNKQITELSPEWFTLKPK